MAGYQNLENSDPNEMNNENVDNGVEKYMKRPRVFKKEMKEKLEKL